MSLPKIILTNQGQKVKLNCPFSKVYNPILDLPISDGAFRTLICILKRDFEDRNGYRKGYVYATSETLAEERGKDIRAIQRHLKELEEEKLIERVGKVKIFILYHNFLDQSQLENEERQYCHSGFEADDIFVAENGDERSGKTSREEIYDPFAAASEEEQDYLKKEENNNVVVGNSFKTDSNADPDTNPESISLNGRGIDAGEVVGSSQDKEREASKKDSNPPEVKHKDLKRLSSLQYKRLSRHFSKELVDRAIKQADLQYKGKKIRKPFGLIYAMLRHGLDDSLLKEHERKERKYSKETIERAFRYLCEHPEEWMDIYPPTRGKLEDLKKRYDGDLPRIIAEEYEDMLKGFVVQDFLNSLQ
jgi:hypothetical protein